MRKIITALLVVMSAISSKAAVKVPADSDLANALKGDDKEIVIEGTYEIKSDITVPSGYVITLAEGAKLNFAVKKNYFIYKTYYQLTGEGTLVSSSKAITTTQTRTLPEIAPSINRFSGVKYDVTEIVKAGGAVSRADSVKCNQENRVSVDGGASWVVIEGTPVAVVCKVSSGINGGRTFVKAYTSLLDACAAVKTDGSECVFLLSDASISISSDHLTKGFTLDCAGNTCNGGGSKEVKNGAKLAYLNAKNAQSLRLTNGGASFINCEAMSVYNEVNNNDSARNNYIHVYDAKTLPAVTYSSSAILETAGCGICFFSGGVYPSYSLKNDAYKNNIHIYGGSFSFDPTEKIAGGLDLVVKESDAIWTVSEKVAECQAKIGDKEFTDIQSAVDEAKEYETVVLQKNVALVSPIVISQEKSITLELGEYGISAEEGAIVNNGTLTIVNSTKADSTSAVLSTTSGNLIVNSGNLKIAYGSYDGDILLKGGCMTVYNGKFTGSVNIDPSVADPSSCIELRGGGFAKSVSEKLENGYIETFAEGFYWVGKFPYPIVNEIEMGGYERAWEIDALPESDRELLYRSSKRSDFSDVEWLRLAELESMYKPYGGYIMDLVIRFNRQVNENTVTAGIVQKSIGPTPTQLDRNLASGEPYRVLSSKIVKSQIDYKRFVSGEFKRLAAGIKNDSQANAGTLCTIEFQLCHSNRTTNAIETDYVLASESYQFPWKDAIPELREDDTPETLASALAGTADAKVLENIKDVQAYNSYQKWAAGVKGATAEEVKSAPDAWLSYALNTTNLVEKPVAGDLKVESFAPSSLETGAFTLELSLKDIDIGSGSVSAEVMKENLDKVFALEGASSLDPAAFSTDNVVYSFGTPVNGKVPVEAKSADGSSDRFFIRARCAAE